MRYLPEACFRSLLPQKECWNCSLELIAEASSPLLRGLLLCASGFQSVEWTQPFPVCPVIRMRWISLCTRRDYQILYQFFCSKQLQSALTKESDKENKGNPRFEGRLREKKQAM